MVLDSPVLFTIQSVMKGRRKMRVNVDRSLCDLHANCVFTAPEVFSMTDEDELVYDPEPADSQEAAVTRAAAECPVQAISILRA